MKTPIRAEPNPAVKPAASDSEPEKLPPAAPRRSFLRLARDSTHFLHGFPRYLSRRRLCRTCRSASFPRRLRTLGLRHGALALAHKLGGATLHFFHGCVGAADDG